MSPDRRVDEESRTRIAALEESWAVAVKRLDHRYRVVAILLIIGMVLTVLSVTVGYAALQGQRWDQTRDGCERTNRNTEATVGLLRELKVRQRVVRIAERRYPHTPPLVTPPRGYHGPMSCEGFADERVGWFRL